MYKIPANNQDSGLETKISIIVPCYNALSKIGRCVQSLDSLDFDESLLEVIFVDDCSTDGTVELIRRVCRTRSNWSLIELESNSGSPSKPRNVGVANANGEFVFFLDADDEVLPSALAEQYAYATTWKADVVRAPLFVAENGKEPRLVNQVPDFRDNSPEIHKIAALLAQQSTTNSSLIRREMLVDKSIAWPEHLHMGEDTVFLISVMTQSRFIGYVDSPAIIYNKFTSASKSATQTYGGRELDSHLEVWRSSEERLRAIGLSYLSIRGEVGIRVAVEAVHKYYAGDITPEHLERFSEFLADYSDAIDQMTFPERVENTLRLVRERNYLEFLEDIKPRLVIAGFDLKFILDAVPALQDHFQIRIDQWTGHADHNSETSEELLRWAEVIWCEWLLGNAVWYAEKKRWNQKLFVRLHLFELTRDYGNRIQLEKVDCFVSVSVPTAEDMIETFGYPRHKVRVIPNFVDLQSYETAEDPSRVFRLSMVGTLPARKGLLKALQLLKSLRDVDSRYTLTLLGKSPQDLAWVYDSPTERGYYETCDQYIRMHQLGDVVQTSGWVNTKTHLSNFGFVLSLSDFESFHVAPAESFAAGNQAVFLPWRGVEFIYPAAYIFEDIYAIRDYILEQRDIGAFEDSSRPGRDYVTKMYSLERFATLVHQMSAEV